MINDRDVRDVRLLKGIVMYVAVALVSVLLGTATAQATCVGTPNGTVEGVEQCDDGNLDDFDNCLSDCTIAQCQDAILHTHGVCVPGGGQHCTTDGECFTPNTCDTGNGLEECDPPASLGGNANCRDDCTETVCGDGTAELDEQCDPPFSQGGAVGCNDNCLEKCGNGIINTAAGEECDGTELAGETCASQGFTTGDLTCTGCLLDTSACTTCGDGTVEGAEECDPPHSQGGAVGCNDSCAMLCGNGSINTGVGETCDGTNLGGKSCVTEGYTEGTLTCDACTLDESACTTCGDSAVEGDEECDPPWASGGAVGCGTDCRLRVCGDSAINSGAGEECDPPASQSGVTECRDDCTLATCGDSTLEAGEECDPPYASGGAVGCDAACLMQCGNGTRNPGLGEACDDTDFDSQTCITQGFDDGDLACNTNCSLNTDACTTCGDSVVEGAETCDPPFAQGGVPGCNNSCTLLCGNALRNPAYGEACDGTDLDSQTCLTEGFDGGDLTCNADCTLNSDACTTCGDSVVEGAETCDPPNSQGGAIGCNDSCTDVCGNGSINAGAGEECDGTSLGSNTCATEGFTEGTLTCNGDCTLNSDACTTCGDSAIEGDETCDPPFSQGGAVGCNNSCRDQCGNSSVQGSVGEECDPPASLGGNANCRDDCTETVCGDGTVELAEECDPPHSQGGDIGCHTDCLMYCGNGTLNATTGEQCDDTDLGSATCANQGFTEGDLSCNTDCTLSTDACTTCGDSVVEGNETCDPPFSQGGDVGCGNSCEQVCGNGTLNAGAGEECDPPASQSGVTECRDNCTLATCGDSSLEAGEECDPPFGSGGALGCGPDCLLKVCGDGTINSGAGEECDPPASQSGAANCRDDCTETECGDGTVELAEECDPPHSQGGNVGCNDSCLNLCGNGTRNAGVGEDCDDTDFGSQTCAGEGFTEGTLACDVDCSLNTDGCTTCGDEAVEGNEECDPPWNGTPATLGCGTDCRVKECGDGINNTGAGEECDDAPCLCTAPFKAADGKECGTALGKQRCDADGGTCDTGTCNSDLQADHCRMDCSNPGCGDGVLDSDEVCDDGNAGGLLDDADSCPSGPASQAKVVDLDGPGPLPAFSLDCNIREGCANGIPRIVDTSATCSGYCPTGTEACDAGDGFLWVANPALSVPPTPIPVAKKCLQNPLVECSIDADCGSEGPCGNANIADHCRTDCTLPRCGDDIVDSADTCDDGDAVCSGGAAAGQECTTLAGWEACEPIGGGTCRDATDSANCNIPGNCNTDGEADACRSDCGLTSCGDGTTDTGEDCDDANSNENDDCRNNCTAPYCGDEVVWNEGSGTEQCDPPHATGGLIGCHSDCQMYCGNGVLNPATGEECDDTDLGTETCVSQGFTQGDLACNAGCTLDTSACTTCGDGVVEGGETCDPPYSQGGAVGCNTSCQLLCGNGSIQAGLGEECDGTNLGGQTCSSQGYTAGDLACGADCKFDASGCTSCGNGMVETGEECDDGNTNPNDNCRNNCVAAVCGDSIVNDERAPVAEQCDDGNSLNGDGCSPACCNEASGTMELLDTFDPMSCYTTALRSETQAAVFPDLDARMQKRLLKKYDSIDKKVERVLLALNKGIPASRTCGKLRSIERQADRSVPRLLERAGFKGWLSEGLSNQLEAKLQGIEDLAKQAKAAVGCIN